jgi:hypothetical protein
MIGAANDEVNYKSGTPIEDKRAARRDWVKRVPWFALVVAYVDDRGRYESDRQAAADVAPDRRRGWVAGNDRLLALIALLDALQDWQGDESGTRRSVPAGVEFVADVLAVLGFGGGIKGETLDVYVAEFLEYLRRAGRVVLVREAKRTTRDKTDADAREYLTYFGRELVAHEPHAEPRCWRKPVVIEQPREVRETNPAPLPAPLPVEHVNRLEAERDVNREPTKAAIEFKVNDAAMCAQVKFTAAGKRPTAAQKSEPPAPKQWRTGTDALREIASGRMAVQEARGRGLVPDH